ncbi:MAG: DUF1194 domain-containing protein [Kiloniellales bacterium]
MPRSRTLLAGIATALIALLAPATGPHAQDTWTPEGEPVELELLLALDASSSVDDREFALQRYGLAQAFREPAVLAAIEATHGGIAVALAQWSSGGRQVIAIDWTKVSDATEADHLADALVRMPRIIPGGDTSLRGIINFAARQFDGNGFAGQRQVIDISADGGAIENPAAMPGPARDAAVALGITINGLTILNDVPDLDHYFRQHVIGGPGAFVVTADTYRDYARAIASKLIQEIGARPVVRLEPPPVLGNELAAAR